MKKQYMTAGALVLALIVAAILWVAAGSQTNHQPAATQAPVGSRLMPSSAPASTPAPASPSTSPTPQPPHIRAANPHWHAIAAKDGTHPHVSRSTQQKIDWCGKTPLSNTAKNRAKGVVWLTFDDSGSTAQVTKILDTLDHYKVRGRFFLINQWAAQNPALVKRMQAEGHVVGNHSWSHAQLLRVRKAAHGWMAFDQPQKLIERELTKGAIPADWVRFPYGQYDDRVLGLMSELHSTDGKPVRACGWTVDSLDWDHAHTPSAAVELKRIQSEMSPNAVVLMHLHGRFTPGILPDLITWLHKQGYHTEPLS